MRTSGILATCLLWGLSGGARGDQAPFPSREEIQKAVKQLGDPEHWIRQAALDALAAWGKNQPDRILRELPDQAEDADVSSCIDDLRWKIPLLAAREEALRLAGDNAPLAEALRNAFGDPGIVTFSAVRLRAGDRLGEFAVPLSIFLEDRNAMVRATAIDLISRCKTEACAPQLIRLLSSDPDWNVRAASALALADLGKTDAVPDILPLLLAPDHGLRMTAGIALERLKNALSPAQLFPLLAHDNAGVQMSVLQVLGAVATKADIPGIVPFLSHGEFGVRRAAMSAVMAIGDPAPLPEIMKRLFDADHSIRDAAARFIGLHGDASLLPALAALLDKGAFNGDADKFAAKAMAGIVGEDWQYDVDRARAWWKEHRSTPAKEKNPE